MNARRSEGGYQPADDGKPRGSPTRGGTGVWSPTDAERRGWDRGIAAARAAVHDLPWKLRREAEREGRKLTEAQLRILDGFAELAEVAVLLASLDQR